MKQAVKIFLDDFSKQVKEKKYKKINYNLWRDLVQKEHELASVRIEYSLSASARNGIEICFEVGDGDCLFEADDGSFGQYLYDWYKKQHIATLKPTIEKLEESFAKVAEAAKNTTANLNIASVDLAITASLNDAIVYGGTSTGWNVYDSSPAVEVNSNYFKVNGQTIEEMVEELVNKYNKEEKEENNNMNLFKGFEFGSCENDNVKMSMYGIAVKNAAGTWVSYDAKNEQVVDVDILNFNGKYLYKMPVAIKDVAMGDCVIHNRKPMFVTGVDTNKLLVIDPAAGEEKVVLLTRNMFGFDFVTKIVNIFGNFADGASADAPFGNMLPLMLMSEGSSSDNMLPLLLMMNGGQLDMSNPMMMYFLMGDNNKNSDLPLLMLAASGQGLAFGKNECKCK